MPDIRVHCPACNSELVIDQQYEDQEVECGSCFQVFVARSEKPPVPDEAQERPAGSSRRPARRRDDDEDDDRDRRPARRRRRDDDDYDRPRDRSPRKSRVAYILLGVFLGELGIHNFYAGHTNNGTAQLLITLLSIPLMCVFIGFFTIFIPFVWKIVDVCTVDRDGDGRLME
ncbi:MAG: TM2 domain-containing protein [Planctomycetia bacterium]|nr:TM2 domain-containing protein [Planctomycetia bacterium]